MGKVNFKWIAFVFCIAFGVSAIVLYRYMAKSLKVTDQITRDQLKTISSSGSAAIPSGNSSAQLGGILYVNMCVECHRSDGSGGRGPALVRSDWTFDRDRIRYIETMIHNGNPSAGMPAFAGRIRNEDIGRIVAYIEWMNDANNRKQEVNQ
ncbi:cytochrome c [bacterium]|nr:cytochrome c [bacterium]